MKMKARYYKCKKGNHYYQRAVPANLTYHHKWVLEPVAGGTHVRQIDVDRGGFLWFWDSSLVEPAYRRANEALAARVSALEE